MKLSKFTVFMLIAALACFVSSLVYFNPWFGFAAGSCSIIALCSLHGDREYYYGSYHEE